MLRGHLIRALASIAVPLTTCSPTFVVLAIDLGWQQELAPATVEKCDTNLQRSIRQ